MAKTLTDYWLAQATKHERMSATLRAKHAKTGEARWLKQAQGNADTAKCIRAKWGKPA